MSKKKIWPLILIILISISCLFYGFLRIRTNYGVVLYEKSDSVFSEGFQDDAIFEELFRFSDDAVIHDVELLFVDYAQINNTGVINLIYSNVETEEVLATGEISIPEITEWKWISSNLSNEILVSAGDEIKLTAVVQDFPSEGALSSVLTEDGKHLALRIQSNLWDSFQKLYVLIAAMLLIILLVSYILLFIKGMSEHYVALGVLAILAGLVVTILMPRVADFMPMHEGYKIYLAQLSMTDSLKRLIGIIIYLLGMGYVLWRLPVGKHIFLMVGMIPTILYVVGSKKEVLMLLGPWVMLSTYLKMRYGEENRWRKVDVILFAMSGTLSIISVAKYVLQRDGSGLNLDEIFLSTFGTHFGVPNALPQHIAILSLIVCICAVLLRNENEPQIRSSDRVLFLVGSIFGVVLTGGKMALSCLPIVFIGLQSPRMNIKKINITCIKKRQVYIAIILQSLTVLCLFLRAQ